jgi:hypothetical protein
LPQPPNQPNQQSLELLKHAGISSSTALNRAAVLAPEAVQEIIRLSQQRPRQHRAGWIVRECDARLAAPTQTPAQEAPDVPDEDYAQLPKPFMPWELDDYVLGG